MYLDCSRAAKNPWRGHLKDSSMMQIYMIVSISVEHYYDILLNKNEDNEQQSSSKCHLNV